MILKTANINWIIKFNLILLILVIVSGCADKREKLISYLNPEIEYLGRIDTSGIDGADLYWPGTSVKLLFDGESIEVLLKDESGNNYYNVIIDNENVLTIQPDTIQKYYLLANKLPKGEHSVEIFKLTEWDIGKTTFYGFKIDSTATVLKKKKLKKKTIEFYGNSITTGYAVEKEPSDDAPDSTFTNNYLSYAAITSRHYNAKYQCICKSGIGITISWLPLIMPEMYDRIVPEDSTSIWNFSLYTPDIVVINLFQNDSWLINMPRRAEYKKRLANKTLDDEYFINAYQGFVTSLREHYPRASIICALGNMDASKEGSKWITYIQKAVANLNDENIYTHFIPHKGTRGHPSIKEQEDIANSLIQFIDENISW